MSKIMNIRTVKAEELEALLHHWWGKGKAASTMLWLYEETPLDLVILETPQFELHHKSESTFGRLFGSAMEIVWRQQAHTKDYHVRIIVEANMLKNGELGAEQDWLPIQKKDSQDRNLLFLEGQRGEQKENKRLAIDHYTLTVEKSAEQHPVLNVWVEVIDEGGTA